MAEIPVPDAHRCSTHRGAADPSPCPGVRVPGANRCLAHLGAAEQQSYLTSLTPGADVDFRGTRFTPQLLRSLLDAVRDVATGRPIFRVAEFSAAEFQSDADFSFATFRKNALFAHAIFKGDAKFGDTLFKAGARFYGATFQGYADFHRSHFTTVIFSKVTFQGSTSFRNMLCDAASFPKASFERADTLGPILSKGRVNLEGATFGAPVIMTIIAKSLSCQRTRWSSTADLRVNGARVDLSGAVFEYPLTVATAPMSITLTPSALAPDPVLRNLRTDHGKASISSLRGVDAAHLVLANVDLSQCLFAGTVHLDQMRIEGDCNFNEAPRGWHWWKWRPVRYTPRATILEEHQWRASGRSADRAWGTGITGATPASLTPAYRALRKSFEDSKNEPGAADFYYGEMEMRRKDVRSSAGERWLLSIYWAMSGYGLRALRALGYLVVSMVATVVLMMQWGLPQDDVKQKAQGMVPPAGGKVTFEIEKTDPVNPTGDRFTSKRFEKALKVTLNSVVFRSSGEELTTSGTYIEMLSRVVEPVFLGMAVLAIRNRVKR